MFNAFVKFLTYVYCAYSSAKLLFIKLNSSIIYSNMKFFDNNPSGRIINRLSNDVLITDYELHVFVSKTLENLAYCLGFPIGVAIYFPWIGITIVIGVLIIYYILNLYRPSNREIKRLSSVNDGKFISILGEVNL